MDEEAQIGKPVIIVMDVVEENGIAYALLGSAECGGDVVPVERLTVDPAAVPALRRLLDGERQG